MRKRIRGIAFVITLVVTSSLTTFAKAWSGTTVVSPNRRIALRLFVADGRLQYSVSAERKAVLDPSKLAITIDGADIGNGVSVGRVESYRTHQTYPYRGVHSIARDYSNGQRISIVHVATATKYTIDIRAYDDGIAFRTRVRPRDSSSHIPDEGTTFTLPAGSTVWYHGFRGHYEGRHIRKDVSVVEPGEWAAPPLTFQLPSNTGYGSITEANLVNFSGMGLQATGDNTFAARLGHAQPPSYPFTLRYGDAEAERLSHPAAITGEIVTPWRVVIIGHDLNSLVNNDIISNLSSAPNKILFPAGVNTPWVRPGRAVWKYLDDPRRGTLEVMREYSNMAHDLGFEYSVVEGMWQRWSVKDLKELVTYSEQRGVRLFLWKHSRDLHDPQARHAFFQLCREVGAAGVKIDFFDHEAKEVVDLYNVLLKEAAENRLLVNFHGANKPTGESRTWPNELTREAVSGMESRLGEGRATHDATLPFTRFLAGPADYTPVNFGARRGDTTVAHQIAAAIVFTSPLLTYGTNPKFLLENPAAEVIKAVPSTWDETVVLPPSQIGEVAVFARRSGTAWFVGVINGPTERQITIPLSFLALGEHKAQIVKDNDNRTNVELEERTLTRERVLGVKLQAGGGFVATFSK